MKYKKIQDKTKYKALGDRTKSCTAEKESNFYPNCHN